MIDVVFVCLGNICRSPCAEGAFRSLLASKGLDNVIGVDSAGTAAYHIGESPDRRSQMAAERRGMDIGHQRARKFNGDDFKKFDYVLAMDSENMRNLKAICPPAEEHKVFLFLSFAPELGYQDVPDPYYGGEQGFETVLDLVEAASIGLLEHINKNHDLQ